MNDPWAAFPQPDAPYVLAFKADPQLTPKDGYAAAPAEPVGRGRPPRVAGPSKKGKGKQVAIGEVPAPKQEKKEIKKRKAQENDDKKGEGSSRKKSKKRN